jgi:3',5'-cyclic AMP phosphodiesterase CpdA
LRRILHVSDIHFGPKHEAKAAAAVSRLVAERQPELVVVSGDLTQRAKPAQFAAARDWAEKLPVPCLCVPGNHDVPLYRVWERLFAPFAAYRTHFSPDLEPVFADQEIAVVGLNTATPWTFKNGRIDRRRLLAVPGRFAQASQGRRAAARIAVLHHPLIPGPGTGDQLVVASAERIAATLEASGVELVLSGHLHYGFLVRSDVGFLPRAGRPFWIVHSGTSTSSRGRASEIGTHTANWIEIGPESFEVTHLELMPEAGRWTGRSRHLLPRRPAAGGPG